MNKRKKEAIAKIIGLGALFILVSYISVAWMTFSIIHPKAGQGTFYTHFTTWITWGQVPELQLQGEE